MTLNFNLSYPSCKERATTKIFLCILYHSFWSAGDKHSNWIKSKELYWLNILQVRIDPLTQQFGFKWFCRFFCLRFAFYRNNSSKVNFLLCQRWKKSYKPLNLAFKAIIIHGVHWCSLRPNHLLNCRKIWCLMSLMHLPTSTQTMPLWSWTVGIVVKQAVMILIYFYQERKLFFFNLKIVSY